MDPFRRGITLAIAAAGPRTPLFSNMPFDTFQANDGLASFDCNWVVSRLRSLLLQEGIPGHYSGHSFRRGAATWAKQVGIPDADIQILGRWKFDSYKRYIKVHPEHIFSVSRRLQTSFPPGPPGARPALSPPTAPSGIPTNTPGIPGSSGRHVGVVGRAGRGAGEPGPASGVAASGTQRGPGRGGRPPAPGA